MESHDNEVKREDACKGGGEKSSGPLEIDKKIENKENVISAVKNDEVGASNGKTQMQETEKINKSTEENKEVEEEENEPNKNKNKTVGGSKLRKQNSTVAKDVEKPEIIIVQKPKRTKSRKSLNKMPSINGIDVDINGNTSLQRTDR